MIFKRSEAMHTEKAGVGMWIYNGKDDFEQVAVAYQRTPHGHNEEFRHTKSAFVFYVISGSGEWVIEGESFPVEATDVVIVPAGKRFYYRGELEQVCITAPAWEAEFEETFRTVEI